LLLPSPPAETTTLSLSWAHVLAMAITLVMLVGVIRQLGKRGYIHEEWWRLGWDGLPGGFCGKYREYLQENQRRRQPKPGDHEPR
jgi:hypothetical protein